MTDDPNGNKPINGTAEGEQQSAIPTENKPAEEVKEEQSLPDQASERTRLEFEKLKAHNKELKEKLSRYETDDKPKSVLDEVRPQYVPSTTSLTEDVVIEDGGYVDADKLQKTLKELKESAQKAKEEAEAARAEMRQYVETEQVKVVHQEVPEIDPYNTEKFNEDIYNLTKLKLVEQMTKGEKTDVKRAALEARQLLSKYQKAPEEPKQEAKEVEKKQEQKIQASSQIKSELPSEDLEELSRRTQKGDSEALRRRLQASGY